MHADEGCLRVAEGRMLLDLLALKASSHALIVCHNLYERLDAPKPGQGAGLLANRKVASACAIRKVYLQAREKLRMDLIQIL